MERTAPTAALMYICIYIKRRFTYLTRAQRRISISAALCTHAASISHGSREREFNDYLSIDMHRSALPSVSVAEAANESVNCRR